MTRLNSASEEKHASPGDSFSSKLTDSGEGSDSEDDDGIMALAGWASNKSNQNSMLKRNIGKDGPQPALHRKNFYQHLDVETDAITHYVTVNRMKAKQRISEHLVFENYKNSG